MDNHEELTHRCEGGSVAGQVAIAEIASFDLWGTVCIYVYMYVYKTCPCQQCIHNILAPSRYISLSSMSLRVDMELAKTDGDWRSHKHILEPYGGVDTGAIALAELYRKANQTHDYRPEHGDHQAFYVFLGSLANAIAIILEAQNTDQLFCAGVYADHFAGIKVDAETLLPFVKTLSNCFSYCSEVLPAAIVLYNWLRQPSDLRHLFKLLGHLKAKAFYEVSRNDKMMRSTIINFNITEDEFVDSCIDAALGERRAKKRKRH